jgi:uncharacterized protein
MFAKKDISFSEAEIKISKSGKGSFTGYASVFGGVDAYNDTIIRGAYAEVIEKIKEGSARMPKMFINHRSWDIPVGKWTKMIEDTKGLWVEGEFTPGNPQAEIVKAGLQHETVDGLSIGFRIGDYEMVDTEEGKLRLIKSVAELPEVSLVTFPADDAARVDLNSVKSSLETITSIKEFEAFLRESGGFSRALATATASKAKRLFSAAQRDSDSNNALPADLRQAIANHISSIQSL